MPDQLTEEQKRLMRLRERQVAARDPHIKTRKFTEYVAERERKRDKSFSVVEAWSLIPHVVKDGFYGLVLGLVLLAYVTKHWISPWAMPVMIALTLIFTIVGIVIGQALDLRDNIKKSLK